MTAKLRFKRPLGLIRGKLRVSFYMLNYGDCEIGKADLAILKTTVIVNPQAYKSDIGDMRETPKDQNYHLRIEI